MRALVSAVAVFIAASACSRPATPPAAVAFVPIPDAPISLQLLPGDLVSWVQSRRPPLRLLAIGALGARENQALEVLASAVSLVDPNGKRLEVDLTFEHSVREGDAQALTPAELKVVPREALGDGWHKLQVDDTRLPGYAAAADRYLEGTLLTARFNVRSAPTVRRIWVCGQAGELRVQFSEPVKLHGELAEVLDLRDGNGEALDCPRSPAASSFDAEGEVLAVRCKGALPEQLGLSLRGEGFTGAEGQPVRDLENKPFIASLELARLPAQGDADGDCHVWVPGGTQPDPKSSEAGKTRK
jgi:hypothetical protein